MGLEALTNQEVEDMEGMDKGVKDKQFQRISWHLIIFASVAVNRVIISRIARPIRMRHLIPIMERVYQKSICGKEISE